MLTVDELMGEAAGWAAAVVAGYLAVGLAAAVVAQHRAAVGGRAERLLALYPRFLRTVLRVLAVAAVGIGTATPAAAAVGGAPVDGKPRPPVVATARPGAEPLDWPVEGGVTRQHLAHRSPSPATPTRVTVRPGDCLWSIAAQALGPAATGAQVAAAWPVWWSANRDLIGDDPDLLRPGLQLRVPTINGRSAS